MKEEFYPGFNIKAKYNPLGFDYGNGVFGPRVENRKLNDIRKSLLNPSVNGPEIVYSIAMDVGRAIDKNEIIKRNLLYGAVTYEKGTLGEEPVRSQGHIHAVSPSCSFSTPEVYEIWKGEAYIYMQESAKDNPGRCFAVIAKKGDVVIVPPSWAHATIVKDINENMTFGAWCVRDYGFDYKDVREHGGIAWFPIVKNNEVTFIKNPKYETDSLIIKEPREYKEFLLEKGKPIYTQFVENKDKFLFVSHPEFYTKIWENFIP